MALSLYRRHRRDCKSGHAEDSLNSEFDERKKHWKRCECPIFVSGTLSGSYRRKSTGQWEWSDAKTAVGAWEKTQTWDGQPIIPARRIPQSEEKRVEIDRATKLFLEELKESAAVATQKKYRLMSRRLNTFSGQLGYVMIDQWEPEDVRAFRSTWPVSAATAVRRMAELKSFFEYCLSNKWIKGNPARAVKNPRTREVHNTKQKLPFSDAEIKKMYEACEKYGATSRHKWKGEDVADFISMSLYTGLRISDVALFRADRMLDSGEIQVRTTKAGTHVYTWVPVWIQERIRARAVKHGSAIFGEHTTKNLDVITELWRRKLNEVWKKCGQWKEPPHPHRFRHTFATILLQKPGVTVRDVAELLGNTEEMVRRAYSAWIPERQERLTRILREAFEERPKLKLIKS